MGVLNRPPTGRSGTAAADGTAADRDGTAAVRDAGAASGRSTGATGLAVAGRLRAGEPARTGQPRGTGRRRLAVHLAVLAGFLAAGAGVTWPRVTYLGRGLLPATRDTGAYVWGFWWMAHQVEHLADPWATTAIAAPVGAQLGYHALMPLAGVLFLPVTAAFGPAVSTNLLAVMLPGLLSYAMYRAARLWLTSQVGAIAAGGFFGLSSMLSWQALAHLNLAAGALFLPLALEAAVRLRRHPGWRQSLALGMVGGAGLLVDQESAVLAGAVAAMALLPWLAAAPSLARLRAVMVAAAAAGIIASPQLIAMAQQAGAGGATSPPHELAVSYLQARISLDQLFAPAPGPLLGLWRLPGLALSGRPGPGVAWIGVFLAAFAAGGLVVAWRRPGTRLLGLLLLGSVIMTLGPVVQIASRLYVPLGYLWHGVRISPVMPYTWFVQLPGLAGFREPDRFAFLAMVPIALLGGALVDWLRPRSGPALGAVLVLAVLQSGTPGTPGIPGPSTPSAATMPAAMPALDGPIAADHSHSVVVDVPFGIRGGLPWLGAQFPPETEVLAAADGHPLANAYISRVPASTLAGIERHPFYRCLLLTQHGPSCPGAELTAAALDARRIDIGWVLVWHNMPAVSRFLGATGFRFAYRAEGVSVYRPAPGGGTPTGTRPG